MIKFYNTLGKISLTGEYFSGLVSTAAKNCYGVAEMAVGGAQDSIKAMVFGDFPDKGVRVTEENSKLIIELHIKVMYGINISTIVKSITHKVRYAVEDATGLKVQRIDVSVDDIV